MNIKKVTLEDNVTISKFLIEHWGSTQIVITSGVFDASKLDGFFISNSENQIIGLITFFIDNEQCEIISLDSILKGQGIGSMLLDKLENYLNDAGCNNIKVITTNDNVDALYFYQKRGFKLFKIHNKAVEKARLIKPQIPLTNKNGIVIRDEIELRKDL